MGRSRFLFLEFAVSLGKEKSTVWGQFEQTAVSLCFILSVEMNVYSFLEVLLCSEAPIPTRNCKQTNTKLSAKLAFRFPGLSFGEMVEWGVAREGHYPVEFELNCSCTYLLPLPPG